ncbi:MAG: radical SAM-associated putative lipoprotein, partial [Paludibacteraceae bacterium]|nr:radical SAM-associated putative lipoprotein [Paludibacteraceae bacterium]
KGIQGIKVYMRTAEAYEYNMFEENPTAADTTTTDGAFEINCTEFPEREIWLVAEDIDSTENGSYKRDSVLITPEFKDVPNNNWHSTTVIKDIVITLEGEKEQPLN